MTNGFRRSIPYLRPRVSGAEESCLELGVFEVEFSGTPPIENKVFVADSRDGFEKNKPQK
jgi:hypothetical protein